MKMSEIKKDEQADPNVVVVDRKQGFGKTSAFRSWMTTCSKGIIYRCREVHRNSKNNTKRESNHAGDEISERVYHVEYGRHFFPTNIPQHVRCLVKRGRHIVNEHERASKAVLRNSKAETNQQYLNQVMRQDGQLFGRRTNGRPSKQQEERSTDILGKLKVVDELKPSTSDFP